MIWHLLRRDPVWRAAPLGVLILAVIPHVMKGTALHNAAVNGGIVVDSATALGAKPETGTPPHASTQSQSELFREQVRFVPEHWTSTYNHWLENVHDWCISRQLWWGHRIPAWYDNSGRAWVAPERCPYSPA